MQFNDTLVPLSQFPYYTGEAYDRIQIVQYTKPGFTNPTVRLFLYSVQQNISAEVDVADVAQGEFYITQVVWMQENEFAVRRVNRAQNASLLLQCTFSSTVPPDQMIQCTILNSHSVPSGWLAIDTSPNAGTPVFLPTRYVDIEPDPQGYHHLVLYDISAPNASRGVFLTTGDWEVGAVVAFDGTSSIYFLGNAMGPSTQHVFRVDTNAHNATSSPDCLSCRFGPGCQFVSAQFSPGAASFILTCLGPAVPQQLAMSSTNLTKRACWLWALRRWLLRWGRSLVAARSSACAADERGARALVGHEDGHANEAVPVHSDQRQHRSQRQPSTAAWFRPVAALPGYLSRVRRTREPAGAADLRSWLGRLPGQFAGLHCRQC